MDFSVFSNGPCRFRSFRIAHLVFTFATYPDSVSKPGEKGVDRGREGGTEVGGQRQMSASIVLSADFTPGTAHAAICMVKTRFFETKVVIIAEHPASSNSLNAFLPEI